MNYEQKEKTDSTKIQTQKYIKSMPVDFKYRESIINRENRSNVT